jgi:hypothetical protein
MRWLLVAVPFYGYSDRIRAALEARGDEVDVVLTDEYPGNHRFTRLILGRFESVPFIGPVLRKLRLDAMDRRLRDDLVGRDGRTFDRILIIRGVGVGPLAGGEILRLKKNPEARDVLYLWDSLENMKGRLAPRSGLPLVTVTFDEQDALSQSWAYLRLFSSGSYLVPLEPAQWDASYVGSGSIERLLLLRRLRKVFRAVGATYRFVTPFGSSWKRGVARLLIGRDSYWALESLPFCDVLRVQASSRVVIDLPQHVQTGATIRCIEMIDAGIPIVTFFPTPSLYGDEEVRSSVVVLRDVDELKENLSTAAQGNLKPFDQVIAEAKRLVGHWTNGSASIAAWLRKIEEHYT